MGSIVPNLTSKYPCDEVSGSLIDIISGKNISVLSGSPSYNQPGIELDGATAALTWGDNAASPIRGSIPYNGYYKVKVTDQHVGEQRFYMFPKATGLEREGPALGWNDDALSNTFRFFCHLAAGTAVVNLDIGRALIIGEIFALCFSYSRNTQVANLVVKSDQEINVSGTATGTTLPGWSAGDFMEIGTDTANAFMATELQEIGAQESPATTATIKDLQDTADEVLGLGLTSRIIPETIGDSIVGQTVPRSIYKT